MVFSSEHRILIEQLHCSKGYGAKKLVKKFPEKGWKVCSLGLYNEIYKMASIHYLGFLKV